MKESCEVRKWLVVLAFDEDDERSAQEFVDSVTLTGGVEIAVCGTWQSAYATVERGPYREETP
jgi:hypothetical protein